jgi:hypothetical protein
MKKLFLLFVALFSVNYAATAQINTPAASPSSTVMQTVGLTDITIEYSRPSAKTRTIFSADGLVPYGKMWRTGANSATKISFGEAIKIQGIEAPAGSYAIITIPGESDWTVNLYPYEGGSWSSYVDQTPAVTFVVKSRKTSDFTETYTMSFDNVGSSSADMTMRWANTAVSIKVDVDVDDKVMKNIESVMAGPSAGDFYSAATYYHTAGKDLNQALTWIQKATKVDSPKFWQVRREALILADMGMYKEAINAANLSRDLAMKAGNDEYVKMNEESVKAWTGKK